MARPVIRELYGISADQIDPFMASVNNVGWREDKLEKDFYLTAILNRIAGLQKGYVFKGGTCLNKCHFGYYRLSEDLDFSLIAGTGNRGQRSVLIQNFFDDVGKICEELGMTKVDERKRDENRFGGMERTYRSLITGGTQTILFDIKVYKELCRELIILPVQDLYTNPLSGEPIFPRQSITCISLEEAMAEKMRAALTRQTPAIRDFYDIWYAQQQGFDFETIRDLVITKVGEVGNKMTALSEDAYNSLQKQVETDLKPVLFSLGGFDIKRTHEYVTGFLL